MKETLKGHLVTSLILAIIAVGGIVGANQVMASKADETEIIEVDFEQTAQSQSSPAQTSSETGQTNQFIYLIGLAALGLLGIAGVVRDVRHDQAV